MLRMKTQGNYSSSCHNKKKSQDKCQGLFYLDKFGDAAAWCVFKCLSVFISEEQISMFMRTCVSVQHCLERDSIHNLESRNSQLSGNDLQHQCQLPFLFY